MPRRSAYAQAPAQARSWSAAQAAPWKPPIVRLGRRTRHHLAQLAQVAGEVLGLQPNRITSHITSQIGAGSSRIADGALVPPASAAFDRDDCKLPCQAGVSQPRDGASHGALANSTGKTCQAEPEMAGNWRRGRDSNPRNGDTVRLISSQVHSTTLPPLLFARCLAGLAARSTILSQRLRVQALVRSVRLASLVSLRRVLQRCPGSNGAASVMVPVVTT